MPKAARGVKIIKSGKLRAPVKQYLTGGGIMHKTVNMLRSYLLRFFIRLCVSLVTLFIYIKRRPALDFTVQGGIFAPVNLLWVILLASFALQLSPRSRVSRGCLKQFPQNFDRIENAVDGFLMHTKLKKLNLGATRVAIIWEIPNMAFAVLYYTGVFDVPEMLLITVLYYLCDVICIVFYCPFQRLFMKNKCCVTCRIFAWGTIMTVTPLIFIPSFYSWSLVALAIVCTAIWEITYRRHPERFCEETNAFLTCASCTDRLCLVKRALEKTPGRG